MEQLRDVSETQKKSYRDKEGEMQNKETEQKEAITETTVKNTVKLNVHPKEFILSKFLTSHKGLSLYVRINSYIDS